MVLPIRPIEASWCFWAIVWMSWIASSKKVLVPSVFGCIPMERATNMFGLLKVIGWPQSSGSTQLSLM